MGVTIKGYQYDFKFKLIKTNDFCYICKYYRKKCTAYIHISKAELDKFFTLTDESAQNLDEQIFFLSFHSHICNLEELNARTSVDKKDYTNADDEYAKAKHLLKMFISKPFNVIKAQIIKEKIFWTDSKINNELNKVRNELFPKNEFFLADISNIVIDLDETSNLKSLPFCIANHSFLNYMKNTTEKYLFITTQFQLKLISKAKMILIDGTFKSCPAIYYQILNFLAYLPDEDIYVPIAYILMSSKIEELYVKVFQCLKENLNLLNITVDFKNIKFMTNFEKGLRKGIIQEFTDSLIYGCYFHYTKEFWVKAKRIGLTTKKRLPKAKILLFALKM